MSYVRNLPYNDLPDLPPKVDLETKPVLKGALKAHAALAELRGIGSQIPQHTLIIRAIGLQEALASSHLDNIAASTDEIYLALANSTERPTAATLEVVRYHDAFIGALGTLQDRPRLGEDLYCQIASTISQQKISIRDSVEIKVLDANGRTIYTPPSGQAVIRAKLGNLEQFLRTESDLDPLVKLAVLHYQFEAIHPLEDCNGRCGRIVAVLYLTMQKLLDIPVFYLSKYLLERRADYYSFHRLVTEEGAWHMWVSFMLEAICEAARQTTEKVLAIKALGLEMQELVKERLPKMYSWELLELLFYQPYCKIRFLEERAIAKRQTAAVYLRALEEIGVVQSIKVGRDNYFINRRFLNVLGK
jgi:Fic family protein